MKKKKDGIGRKTPNLKINYLYKLVYEVLIIITPFITTPYVARVLGADGVGIYSYTQSYMTFFSMFAALGTASYGMREIARCRDNPEEYSKKFWEIELITVFTTLICLAAWVIFASQNKEYGVFLFALTPILLATIFDISWFYTGHEKVSYTVFWNSICKILGIVAIFVFVKQKGDLVKYILIQSIMLLVGNISMWIHLPKFLVRVSPQNFRYVHHIKETLVYFVPTIASSLYIVLDKTLLGLITHDSFENGYYEQAAKLINMGKTVVFVAVNSVMEARISYLFVENRIDEIKVKISKSIDFIFLLGVGFSFGIVSTARSFVPVFFGVGYEPVIKLIYLMAPLVVIIGISNCIGSHYYTPAGYRSKSARYIIVGALSNLVLNLCLIPNYKSEGAVIASIAAETVISILYLINCEGFMTCRIIVSKLYKKIIAGMIMLAVVTGINYLEFESNVIVLILQVIVGTCTYFAILVMLKDHIVNEYLNIIIHKIKSMGGKKG